jgi:hypothetical protein
MPDTLAVPVTVVATGSTGDLDHTKPGIALCFTGMRRRVEPGTTSRPAFPYPNRGV